MGIVIESDPAMTARILRLANSAFFGYSTGIKTVGDALIVIGIQQIRDIVLSTAVVDFFKEIPHEQVDMDSFWLHSLGCGLGARILAGYRRSSNPEQSFAAGLMHDLGRLVIFMQAPEKANDIFVRYAEEDKPLCRIEEEVLGYTHAEVGGVLLAKWNLPAALVDAVRYHIEPSQCGVHPVDAALVHMGDVLAQAMQIGSAGDREVPEIDLDAWKAIGLDEEILKPTIHEIDRQLNDVADTFIRANPAEDHHA